MYEFPVLLEMVTEAVELRKTPLYQIHVDSGADMKPFGGSLMPMTYPTGGLTEHHAVRTAGGIFDVSHMGRLHIRGTDAQRFVSAMIPSDMGKVHLNQAKYTVLLNRQGGIIDDAIFYKTDDPEDVPVVVNASNRETDINWFNANKAGMDVEIVDETDETALIAVQGPASIGLVRSLSHQLELPDYYYFSEDNRVAGVQMFISRTGYTGEDGVELWFDARYAVDVWRDLLEVGEDLGVVAAGLGARNSLRLEAGFALHGHEITPEINPYEAGLGWVVSLESHDFIGKDALIAAKEQGLGRKLAGFKTFSKSAPRNEQPDRPADDIFVEDKRVGTIVSGVSSPTLGYGIGTGFMTPAELAVSGRRVMLGQAGGRMQEAEVVVPARFYKRPVTA